MKTIVRKGYVVHFRKKMYGEGMEIPSPILEEVVKNQSWKLEEVDDGKKEERKEETEEAEKIEEISANRMVGDALVKKRGK